MQWCDQAIVLSVKPHGENAALVRLLAREHGLYGGMVKTARSKTSRGVFEPGNKLLVTWNARLSEHLGSLRGELLEPCVALLMQDETALTALSSLCSLLERALPERVVEPALWAGFEHFTARLREGKAWHKTYVEFELLVLRECGFQLDLTHCAATGETENLAYVSPKSGRAVSLEAGRPYHDRLLTLPAFLRGNLEKNDITAQETLEGLVLCGYFLDHWLLAPHGRKLPAARRRLTEIVKEKAIKHHGEDA
jgi:DNA repair protein RecO (recombination protein O)